MKNTKFYTIQYFSSSINDCDNTMYVNRYKQITSALAQAQSTHQAQSNIC